MQHLDDGRIAEFLDEALTAEARATVEGHLAACAACRDRLDEAARVRARAADILARTGPRDLAGPPFETIAKRAGRADRTRPRVRYLRIVAWAATIVTAAGVGWYARDVALRPGFSSPVDRTESTRAAPAAVPAPVQPNDRADAERSGRGAVAAVVDSSPAPVLERAPEPQPGEPALRERRDPRAGELAEGAAGAPAEAERRIALERQEVANVAPNVDLRDVAAEAVTGEPLAAPTAAVAEDVDPTWRTVSLEEAAQLLGGDVVQVDGLATLGHAVRLERDSYVVRTVQRLGDAELEVIQRPDDSRAVAERDEADTAVFAREGGRALQSRTTAETTVRKSGYVITLRAPVSPDSLRALLLRLVP